MYSCGCSWHKKIPVISITNICCSVFGNTSVSCHAVLPFRDFPPRRIVLPSLFLLFDKHTTCAPLSLCVFLSVCLRDVHFSYPSRPMEEVLEGFNLKVEPGTTVALVSAH